MAPSEGTGNKAAQSSPAGKIHNRHCSASSALTGGKSFTTELRHMVKDDWKRLNKRPTNWIFDPPSSQIDRTWRSASSDLHWGSKYAATTSKRCWGKALTASSTDKEYWNTPPLWGSA